MFNEPYFFCLLKVVFTSRLLYVSAKVTETKATHTRELFCFTSSAEDRLRGVPADLLSLAVLAYFHSELGEDTAKRTQCLRMELGLRMITENPKKQSAVSPILFPLMV